MKSNKFSIVFFVATFATLFVALARFQVAEAFFLALPSTRSSNYPAKCQRLAFLNMVVSSQDLSTRKNQTDYEEPTPTPKGYQRIEEWNKQHKDDAWGDKVQFDGQRFGNQLRQNDILNRHLKGF